MKRVPDRVRVGKWFRPFSVALALALCLSVAPTVVGPSQVAAQSQRPTRTLVRQMLSGFEDSPTRAQWRALGPGAIRVLVSLYNDRSEPAYVRYRSLNAAAHFPSRATRTFLLGVAQTPGQSDLYIRQALLSLGRAFGPSAVTAIGGFQDSPHSAVREAVVISLSRIGNAQALAILRGRMATESEAHIRERLVRAVPQNP